MNRRAEVGVLGYFMAVVIIVILLAFWLAGFMNTWGNYAIASNSLTGVEAFLWSNIVLVVIFAMVLGLVAVAAYGASR